VRNLFLVYRLHIGAEKQPKSSLMLPTDNYGGGVLSQVSLAIKAIGCVKDKLNACLIPVFSSVEARLQGFRDAVADTDYLRLLLFSLVKHVKESILDVHFNMAPSQSQYRPNFCFWCDDIE